LKSHELKCHAPTRGRKEIRKVGSVENLKSGFDTNSGIRESGFGSEQRNGTIEESMGDSTTLPFQLWPDPVPEYYDCQENFSFDSLFKEGHPNFDLDSFIAHDSNFDNDYYSGLFLNADAQQKQLAPTLILNADAQQVQLAPTLTSTHHSRQTDIEKALDNLQAQIERTNDLENRSFSESSGFPETSQRGKLT
jgi:hypothetical protein